MGARKVVIGRQYGHTEVFCLDEPGPSGACHEYEVRPKGGDGRYAVVNFQNGPIKEHGRNGGQNEDIIVIVLDRLRGFQCGPFSCRDNSIAITMLEGVLQRLNWRTDERMQRGVEGTDTK